LPAGLSFNTGNSMNVTSLVCYLEGMHQSYQLLK
jgi:hypothetical protein